MKKLSKDFIIKNGFEFVLSLDFENGYCEEYHHPEYIYFTIFINYHKHGIIDYEVSIDTVELINVYEDELLTLLKIIPKIEN